MKKIFAKPVLAFALLAGVLGVAAVPANAGATSGYNDWNGYSKSHNYNRWDNDHNRRCNWNSQYNHWGYNKYNSRWDNKCRDNNHHYKHYNNYNNYGNRGNYVYYSYSYSYSYR